MLRKIRGFILIVLVIFVAYAAYADTITLSTFYPSPYGSYQNLDTTGTTYLATDGASRVGIRFAAGTPLNQALDVNGSGLFAGGIIVGNQIVSNVAAPTAPFDIVDTNTTKVVGLNADMVDGVNMDGLEPYILRIGNTTDVAGTTSLFAWMSRLYDKVDNAFSACVPLYQPPGLCAAHAPQCSEISGGGYMAGSFCANILFQVGVF